MAVFVAVAVYLFWRKSDNWVVILVSVALLTLPHSLNLGGYSEDWFLYPTPVDRILRAADQLLDVLGMSVIFFTLFLFPDGRFVPRWMRWVALAPIGLSAIFVAQSLFPVAGDWDEELGWLAFIVIFLLLFLLGG